MRSKAKLFGHPMHPMLIAFPVAFYTGTLVSGIIYAASENLFWFRVAMVCNVAGVVMALVAAIPGLIDYASVIERRSQANKDATKHMLINVGVVAIFALNLLLNLGNWYDALPPAGSTILLSLVGVGLTGVAGGLGWKLVQTHHVGIEAPQRQIQVVYERRKRQIPVEVERRRHVAA